MPRGVLFKLLRKAGAFTTGQLSAGEVGVNTAASRLEFSPDGSSVSPVVSVPAGGATGRVLGKTGSADYAVGWLAPQQIEISWTGNAAATYPAVSACTLSSPTLRGDGSRSVAYAYAADGATFSGTAPTFPLSMAAGSVLRVTLSGFGTWACWGAERR